MYIMISIIKVLYESQVFNLPLKILHCIDYKTVFILLLFVCLVLCVFVPKRIILVFKVNFLRRCLRVIIHGAILLMRQYYNSIICLFYPQDIKNNYIVKICSFFFFCLLGVLQSCICWIYDPNSFLFFSLIFLILLFIILFLFISYAVSISLTFCTVYFSLTSI